MDTTMIGAEPDVARIEALTSVAEIVRTFLPRHRRQTAIRFDDGRGYASLGYDVCLAGTQRMIHLLGEGGPAQRVVATFVKNRPEWDMTALATLYTGNILFPLDTGMNDDELRHLLRLSPPDVLLVSRAQRERILRILREVGLRPHILVADLYPVFEDQAAVVLAALEPNERLLSSAATPAAAAPLPPPSPRLELPDTVLAHYATSGTTSLPKVVRITHRNIVAQIREACGIIQLRPNEDLLNLGPYTHIATLLEFLVTKSQGFAVTYVTREVEDDGVLENEIKKLKQQGVRIKALLAVPKFWVRLVKETLEELKNKPVLNNLYGYLTAIERNAELHDIGTLDKAKLTAVRRTLRSKMGGYFTYGVSSSTRIDPGVVEIFGKLGVTVIDIYGATEASGIIARNELNESRRGSCGKLIDGLEARLLQTQRVPGLPYPVGELAIRGPTVSTGYVGAAPGSHLDADGFYRTGDLAAIDPDRYVYLVGRCKELIQWQDGTFIDPMHLSNLLVRSVWIKDALVTRLRQDDYLSVFLLPDYERLEADRHYRERLRAGLSPDEALRPMLEEAIAYAQSLARITPRLSRETIYLLPRKLERTPTHKIKLGLELARLDLSKTLGGRAAAA